MSTVISNLIYQKNILLEQKKLINRLIAKKEQEVAEKNRIIEETQKTIEGLRAKINELTRQKK